MVVGKEVVFRKGSMDGLGYRIIRHGSRCGFDVRDEVRLLVAIGFGQMDLVANPSYLALGGIARVGVVG